MSAEPVRAFLARHGLAPHRQLGQNFLVDATLAARLVDLAGVSPGDGVIEIGTGTGVLTRALAAAGARVVTLEVDAGLVRALREDDALPDGVTLLHADALAVDLAELAASLGPGPRRLVGNLPYSVSAPLLRRLLDLRPLLRDWSVMLQRDVALRLLARVGSRDYGSLAVLHQLTVTLQRGMELSPNCFFPVPKVRSTFVRVRPLPDGISREELARVERFVRAAFGARRKTLVNAVRAAGLDAQGLLDALARAGLPANARAEALPPERLRELAGVVLPG